LKNLDNHSDTMQLAIFKNLDGMSLGELLDFILRFLMRSWISYGNGNGLLFHTTQPTSRSSIKAIAYSKPTISEN